MLICSVLRICVLVNIRVWSWILREHLVGNFAFMPQWKRRRLYYQTV